MLPVEEQQLMLKAQQDDREAFDQLSDTYRDRLTRFCGKFMPNAEEAKEATQDTFVRAWEKRDTYKPIAPEYNWLCAIARSVCLNRLRINAVATVPNDPENPVLQRLPDPTPPPEDLVIAAEFWPQIMNALCARLSDQDRLICRLYYQQERSPETIAKMLNLNYEALRSQIKRRIKPAVIEALKELNRI